MGRDRSASMFLATDIAAKTEHKKEIRESEERYRRILDSVLEGCTEADLDGNISKSINPDALLKIIERQLSIAFQDD